VEHGHSHGLIDPSIVRSRAGIRAVAASLAVLGATAVAQAVLFHAVILRITWDSWQTVRAH
jgi:hypothetical protein